MNLPHVVTVTPNAAGTVDTEGNVLRTVGTTLTYPGRLYQQTAVETQDGRTVEAVRWKLMLPGDAVIGPHDRATVNGVTYEVDGTPYRVAGSRADHHVEVQLTA